MTEDAVVVYDRDGFLKGTLEKLKARLREMSAESVRLGRKWYWRLWHEVDQF